MRRFVLLPTLAVLAALVFPVPGFLMQEKATLTAPVVSSTTVSDYQVLSVFAQRQLMGYDWRVVIRYLDSLGNEFSDEHTGIGAKPLVLAVDSTTRTKTVNRLALDHLIAEKKIAAAFVTGTPLKE